MKKKQTYFYISLGSLAAFALWTAAVCVVDVKPIGPRGSTVGFAAINDAFHGLTGVHMTLYTLTDWLGLIPIGIALGFALLGFVQLVTRRSLWLVDYSIRALGGFYLAVMTAYFLFEILVINYRPILINGYLEASYPSSTTLLTLCVTITAAIQIQSRIKRPALKRFITAALIIFAVFMVIGRLISGVHWLSDIIGGALLSAGLITMYYAVCGNRKE